MADTDWQDIGAAADFAARPLSEVILGRTKLAISQRDGVLGVISGVCNHVGGPLGQGRLDGDYVVCPWHNWKFHRITGEGEPGFEDDQVPRYEFQVENGRLLVNVDAASKRQKAPHEPHP